MLQKGAGKEKGFVALQNIKVVTEADLTSIDSNKKHSFQVRLSQEASAERLHWQHCFHLLRLGFGVIVHAEFGFWDSLAKLVHCSSVSRLCLYRIFSHE